MNRAASGLLPTITVDRKAATPLYRQVYDGIRSAILRRELRPGQRVPSSRELTRELRVSRFPVLNAYAQLLAEGYFESKVGSGTFVSSSLPEQQMSVTVPVANATSLTSSGPRNVARRALEYPAFDHHAVIRGWGAFGRCV